MTSVRYRIGIDVGGTFTDFVLVDMSSRELWFHKEPSVPCDPSKAIEQGIQSLIDLYDLKPEAVELIVHGTTIGLNAIIQRRGARMALIVSKGNRDVLEIARLRLPSSYDFTEPREAPLVPRNLVFEVSARQLSNGEIQTPVDVNEVKALAGILRNEGIDAVSVMLLNSYRNPSLEIELAAVLQAELADTLITCSSLIWPEIREYERCLIAGLNSYIHPLMKDYFTKMKARVAGHGIGAPIYITANNGGTLSLDTAEARPIDTVLSGPASGVVAATRISKIAKCPEIVTFDMGGTSADIAICQRGEPEFTASTFVGDFPLMMPVVNVGAIGAGGGSLLWVDAQGLLKVGPLSAGADPGPVCYGRGGKVPTITDCYVALGIVDPDRFLDGRMRLDRDAAFTALDAIGIELGIEGDNRALRVAESTIRVATAKMSTEITKLLAQAGVDPRTYALVAYGGAGPTHANYLGQEAQLDRVLIPAGPGTFCALGAVLADVRRDYVRTARHLIDGTGAGSQVGWQTLYQELQALEAEAEAWVATEGTLVGEHNFAVSFNLRYPSQAYELEILIPPERRSEVSANMVCDLFHKEHHRLYGFSEPESALQTSTLRIGVIGRVVPVTLPNVGTQEIVMRGTRNVWNGNAMVEASVYDRAVIGEGGRVDGPAIIEQPDTTTFLLPGWSAQADSLGTLHIRREATQ